MTRINAGIPVTDLVDAHLLAEHREIKRIPNAIKTGKPKLKDIPNEFKLGTGHVKFFYNKLKFLHKRYVSLYNECINRGFNVTNFEESFKNLPDNLYNDWVVNKHSIEIVKQRIEDKLSKMKNTNKTKYKKFY